MTENEETCDAWFSRYVDARRRLGRVTGEGLWRAWISPVLGVRRMAVVQPVDVERVRDALDAAVAAWWRAGGARGRGRISGRTAMNVWWCLSGAFRVARTSKDRDLRILAGRLNPCAEVEPPGDATTRRARQKTFVYPAECARLLACPRVPLEWRELHAVAAYTYLRPGELRVLRWSDVDLDHGMLHVARAWSPTARTTKPPKTPAGVRTVPIEPALGVDLLQRSRLSSRRRTRIIMEHKGSF